MTIMPVPNFKDNHDKARAQLPEWLRAAAVESASRVMAQGLPSRKNEDWRYTDLGFVSNFAGDWTPSNSLGVDWNKLDSTAISAWQSLRLKLNAWLSDNSLEQMNLALNSGGSFVKVKKGNNETLNYSPLTASAKSLFSPRLTLVLEENAQLTVFEDGTLGEGGLSNSYVDVQLSANSKLTYIRLQNNPRGSNQISTVRVVQGRSSSFDYHVFNFGSDVSRDNVLCLLAGEGANCRLQGLSLSRPGQHLDQYVFIDHAAPNAQSHQLFKSVVSNQSRSVFNGRVNVRSGSSGTDARQLNRNLLLGKSAEVDTRPQLEIANDDVKCSHGATIGRLNPEELFYLESRAISRADAINMLCRAFVDEVVLAAPLAYQDRVMTALNENFKGLETDHGL